MNRFCVFVFWGGFFLADCQASLGSWQKVLEVQLPLFLEYVVYGDAVSDPRKRVVRNFIEPRVLAELRRRRWLDDQGQLLRSVKLVGFTADQAKFFAWVDVYDPKGYDQRLALIFEAVPYRRDAAGIFLPWYRGEAPFSFELTGVRSAEP
jgi:hypothetical protein